MRIKEDSQKDITSKKKENINEEKIMLIFTIAEGAQTKQLKF